MTVSMYRVLEKMSEDDDPAFTIIPFNHITASDLKAFEKRAEEGELSGGLLVINKSEFLRIKAKMEAQ